MNSQDASPAAAEDASKAAFPAAPDNLWDELFHSCAWEAYLTVASETGFPADSEKTKRLAYKLYEERIHRPKSG